MQNEGFSSYLRRGSYAISASAPGAIHRPDDGRRERARGCLSRSVGESTCRLAPAASSRSFESACTAASDCCTSAGAVRSGSAAPVRGATSPSRRWFRGRRRSGAGGPARPPGTSSRSIATGRSPRELRSIPSPSPSRRNASTASSLLSPVATLHHIGPEIACWPAPTRWPRPRRFATRFQRRSRRAPLAPEAQASLESELLHLAVRPQSWGAADARPESSARRHAAVRRVEEYLAAHPRVHYPRWPSCVRSRASASARSSTGSASTSACRPPATCDAGA